jgi:glutaredoxin
MKRVYLVTLSTCPWCRKARAWFTRHEIPFEDVKYDLQTVDEQTRLERMIKGKGDELTFPWAEIGSDTVSGWKPKRYAALLGINSET